MIDKRAWPVSLLPACQRMSHLLLIMDPAAEQWIDRADFLS